ncbi:MAG: phosphatidylserine decarboxylase [Pontiella sp.]|nr:phosphatidylserine decarboxylase [Pontiella sp.]NNJ69824.1 phosphatidylserine decarboxylase family protein [Kiritimatiellales bacterium]
MKLSGYGKKEWLGGGILAFLIGAGGMGLVQNGFPAMGWTVAVLALTAWLALAAFFRVPARVVLNDPAVLLSPADGMVKDIGLVRDHGIELYAGQDLMRIGIFLSVFDVHVNRAPCDIQVEYRRYRKGRFHDARDARCAKENESLILAGTGYVGTDSFPVAIRQISGAVARRIVCEPQPGTRLDRGQIYGMIKFGSRTELYFLPNENLSVVVRVGEKVCAGSNALARLDGTGKVA